MDGKQTLIGIKQDSSVSSLKQRTLASVTPVKPDPIARVKPMHRRREARPTPQFQLQMIMVRHQYNGSSRQNAPETAPADSEILRNNAGLEKSPFADARG
jgi:hypothetical protein